MAEMEDIQPARSNEAAAAEIAQDSAGLARLIRETRRNRGWTLEETAKRAGIGRSTLSKIENDQTRAGFDIIRRLTEALDLQTPQLFVQSKSRDIAGRRDITRKGAGEVRKTETYQHELLCTEITSKSMLPYLSRIRARDMSEFGEWVRHRGEEFMYVLEGSVELHTEHYRPLRLGTGDSVYYDASMGHCCISVSEEDALVLWVSQDT
ncbi:helix-turn-helix domain-containing protein [Rhodobacteraceae bacterium MYP1-1]|uniref:Helix-turn-helix domain-containing protein n=2 Tax=Halocynthiibacter styelae TaxID=2761955 RepID=A0A8J7ISE3_9RHOB|nr:helix-turn-helix domain-containing protein [Paenihalocynthiibacter styelae]